MIKKVYRLESIKNENEYIKVGYTKEQARQIINLTYDIDEDAFSVKSYERIAKKLTERLNKKLNLNLTWEQVFGKPFDDGYRYCNKCDTYFYKEDEHECN